MDTKRAHEIMSMDEEVTVQWNGSPVWIESVNDSGQARVHPEGEPREKMTVAVDQLVEVGLRSPAGGQAGVRDGVGQANL